MFVEGTHADLKNPLENIGAAIAIFERDSNKEYLVITANSLFKTLSHLETEEIIGQNLRSLFPRYLFKDLKDEMDRCISEQESLETEIVIDQDGEIRWWRVITSPILGTPGRISRVLATSIDITERKNLEAILDITRRRFEAVVEAAYDGIITIDDNQDIKLMNNAAREMFGLEDADVIGMPLERLIPKQYRTKHPSLVRSFANSPVASRPMHSRAAVRGLRSDGSEFPVEVTISKIIVSGEIEMTAVLRDISERSRLIEELQRNAVLDSLTDIYNRRHMEKVIDREINRSQRFSHALSVVFMDVDNFKPINDNHGHDVGDSVLKQVVSLVEENKREVDIFSRWGGDEFLLLLPETTTSEAVAWSQRLAGIIENTEFAENGLTLKATCSFGVAGYTSDMTQQQLIKKADEALYASKRAGKNQVTG